MNQKKNRTSWKKQANVLTMSVAPRDDLVDLLQRGGTVGQFGGGGSGGGSLWVVGVGSVGDGFASLGRRAGACVRVVVVVAEGHKVLREQGLGKGFG